MEKVGLFLCTGCEIGAAIKTDDLEELAKEKGASSFVSHACLCSDEGLALIHKAIDSGEVDGVLIAACSQREKKDLFSFDKRRVACQRVALREQVAWSHKPQDEDTQMLAEDLLCMGLARVAKEELPKQTEEEIDRTVLVVGGGLAGLTAAKAASGMGHPVVLVEKDEQPGGYLRGIKDMYPTHPPYDSLQANDIADLVAEIEADSSVQVFCASTIKHITGQPGMFDVEVQTAAGIQKLKAGAIVQATGAHPYDAGRLAHLGYGKSPDVITTQQLEQMLRAGKLTCPGSGRAPERVVFIQCAGSRDADHLLYCSGECCAATLAQVAVIHRDHPNAQCMVIYRDMRTPGQMEHFYLGVQEQSGCMFARGEVDQVSVAGSIEVNVKDSLLGKDAILPADMVVLAVGMVPNAADGESIRELIDAEARITKNESETQVTEAKKVVEKLESHRGTEILNLDYRQGPDLSVLRYNFPDSHFICFPYETRRTGIYAAGALHAPMDFAQAEEDGWGAAMKAVQNIRSNTRGEAVHPRAGDVSIAEFFLQRCTQCKRCTEECPFGAINEDEKGTPEYNPLRCRRCGICLGACPERIISFPEYSVDSVASMIKAIEVPDEDEEKPRIVAFMCENDALPALDEAAGRRMQWNPWVRIIPVRCLGAVNTVWIADSLSRGIDGVLLVGCKRGDDYQCHYIRGSELANTRMSNVQETLDRLSLESERVRVLELARNEFDRIPEIFEEFADKIEEIGPNPYKGF
ncbi:MAG TPA: hydrogenase iron-sulfur subunit [Myxococcota bacterium]|nr:hydrogenase iron-sulfur subunit [Myxococcota bacterium]